MERQSLVKHYQIPQMLWGGFLLLTFIALVSPYLDWLIAEGAPGPKVGDFDLLQISASARSLFVYLGPILFLSAIGIHIPIFPIRKDGSEQDSVPVIECEGLAAGDDPPQADYILVDLSHGQEEWYDYSAGIRAVLPVFCRPRVDLASRGVLKGARVTIMALPKIKRLERAETDNLAEWVEKGGSLLLLGYYVWTHHDSNINELAQRLGFEFADNLVLPSTIPEGDLTRHVFGEDTDLPVWFNESDLPAHPLFSRVRKFALQSSATIRLKGNLQPELAIHPNADCTIWEPHGKINPDGVRRVVHPYKKIAVGSDPMLVTFRRGRGRVMAVGTWKVAALDLGDNRQLVRNAIDWLQK